MVLASGTGSLLGALLHAARTPGFPARIVAVGVDRHCAATDVAAGFGVEAFLVSPADFADRAAWNDALTSAVEEHSPDLVVTAGFMRLLGPGFVGRFAGRIINAHPALLPAFPGAHAVPDALAYGVRVTGTTIHLVDTGVDTGPILAQEAIAVAPGEDEASLHERIKTIERRLLVDVVAAAATRGIQIEGRKARFGD